MFPLLILACLMNNMNNRAEPLINNQNERNMANNIIDDIEILLNQRNNANGNQPRRIILAVHPNDPNRPRRLLRQFDRDYRTELVQSALRMAAFFFLSLSLGFFTRLFVELTFGNYAKPK